MTTLSLPKKALILEMQKKNVMELNIHGIAHDSVFVATQQCSFSRKINRKNSDIQVGVVNNFSQFSSVKKHGRFKLVVTNNMSTYEK